MEPQRARADDERGFMMVALLVLMAVMAVAMTVALPAWSTMARREREAELVFRGEQYARAISLFQRKYGGSFPPSIDVLVTERFLRKKYKDPIASDDFQVIGVGEGIAIPTPPGRGGAAGGRGGTAFPPTQQGAARQGGATSGIATSPLGNRGSAAGGSTMTTGATSSPGGRAGGVGVAGASGGIMGVTSKSKAQSLRLYNGRDHYNEWIFLGTQATTQAGGRGAQTPGQGVRGGQPPGGRGGGTTPRRGGPAGPGTPPSPFGAPGGGRGRF